MKFNLQFFARSLWTIRSKGMTTRMPVTCFRFEICNVWTDMLLGDEVGAVRAKIHANRFCLDSPRKRSEGKANFPPKTYGMIST